MKQSKQKLFTIRPLKWKRGAWTPFQHTLVAHVPMGRYYIEEKRDSKTMKWGKPELSWCFDEYYDQGRAGWCHSIKEGKQVAEYDWLDRIMPALKAAH